MNREEIMNGCEFGGVFVGDLDCEEGCSDVHERYGTEPPGESQHE